MEQANEKTIKQIDSRMGRKYRLPFHARDLYVRVSVRQPGLDNVHTLEFTVPNYKYSSHPTERTLQGTAKALFKGLVAAFGKGVQFGGVPIPNKDTYS